MAFGRDLGGEALCEVGRNLCIFHSFSFVRLFSYLFLLVSSLIQFLYDSFWPLQRYLSFSCVVNLIGYQL
jgi:hypothetical protein